MDMSVLQRDLASTRQCLFFLVCQSDYVEILEETSTDTGINRDSLCSKYIDEMLAWPQRLNDHCDKCDERHAEERKKVEEMVAHKKRDFDRKVERLNLKLKQVHEWTNLSAYKHIMDTVHNFHSEVDNLEKLKQEI